MKLTNLKVNHLKNPLGFCVKNPYLFLPGGGKHRQASEIGQNQGIQDGGYDRSGI